MAKGGSTPQAVQGLGGSAGQRGNPSGRQPQLTAFLRNHHAMTQLRAARLTFPGVVSDPGDAADIFEGLGGHQHLIHVLLHLHQDVVEGQHVRVLKVLPVLVQHQERHAVHGPEDILHLAQIGGLPCNTIRSNGTLHHEYAAGWWEGGCSLRAAIRSGCSVRIGLQPRLRLHSLHCPLSFHQSIIVHQGQCTFPPPPPPPRCPLFAVCSTGFYWTFTFAWTMRL